jgi:phospholipase C
MATGLAAVEHVVVLMLENRSFDHMLGYLYAGPSPRGDAFDGLTRAEHCPDAAGKPVNVFPITPTTANAYLMPGADPGEGFAATNAQLFGTERPPAGAVPTNRGFVTNYDLAIAANRSRGWYVVPGTAAGDIMGCFTPEALPVLSALARGYAVCDRWFCSAPTQTMPNRAFACAGTSQGHLDDHTKTFTVPTIFGRLSAASLPWKIYGYDRSPLTRLNFPDTVHAPAGTTGLFTDFQADADAGNLPAFAFMEPAWSSKGNSQHPNYDVARGEQLLLDTYRALHAGPDWGSTLLIITYDEHGGCYDHVAPPATATPPDASTGEFGFDFTRFGLRVPTVLVSPLIDAGTVFRAPSPGPPLDHTSVLATVEHRWSLPPLTSRDAAAPDVGAVLTRSTPRIDDPLDGVTAPAATTLAPEQIEQPSHLVQVRADLTARLIIEGHTDGEPPPGLHTSTDYENYVDQRLRQWNAQGPVSDGTPQS